MPPYTPKINFMPTTNDLHTQSAVSKNRHQKGKLNHSRSAISYGNNRCSGTAGKNVQRVSNESVTV